VRIASRKKITNKKNLCNQRRLLSEMRVVLPYSKAKPIIIFKEIKPTKYLGIFSA